MSLHRTASANIAGMPIVSVTQDIKDQKNFLLFHDGSNHDYHFIIKELAERFESQFECISHKRNWKKHDNNIQNKIL